MHPRTDSEGTLKRTNDYKNPSGHILRAITIKVQSQNSQQTQCGKNHTQDNLGRRW